MEMSLKKNSKRGMTFCMTCGEDIKEKEAIRSKRTGNYYCSDECMQLFEV